MQTFIVLCVCVKEQSHIAIWIDKTTRSHLLNSEHWLFLAHWQCNSWEKFNLMRCSD